MHQEIFTTTHLFTDNDFFRVHWLRYEVMKVIERSSHRRIRRLNATFKVLIDDLGSIGPEHAALYARYRESIDFEGANSIEHALFDDEEDRKSIFSTKAISIYDGARLIAGGYFDLGLTAGSSILHFFDPDYRRTSLGRYMILLTLDHLRSHGYLYYYPGYVVAGKPKMNYKLFLGRDSVTYYDPVSGAWLPFEEKILQPERLTEVDKLQIALAFVA